MKNAIVSDYSNKKISYLQAIRLLCDLCAMSKNEASITLSYESTRS